MNICHRCGHQCARTITPAQLATPSFSAESRQRLTPAPARDVVPLATAVAEELRCYDQCVSVECAKDRSAGADLLDEAAATIKALREQLAETTADAKNMARDWQAALKERDTLSAALALVRVEVAAWRDHVPFVHDNTQSGRIVIAARAATDAANALTHPTTEEPR